MTDYLRRRMQGFDPRNLLAILGFTLVLGVQMLALAHPVLALWSIGLIGVWIAASLPFAVVLGRRIAGPKGGAR